MLIPKRYGYLLFGFIQSGFGAYAVFSGALRGAGDTFVVMVISLISVVGVRCLGALLEAGDIGNQALPLGLPFITGRLERLDLGLRDFELLLELRVQVGEPRLFLGQVGPRLPARS